MNLFNAIVKLLLSAALGGAIGYERKSKGQNAGVGTFSLISIGAALAMILSVYIPQEYFHLKNGDPGRIAAQVITGIGFLGAGTIIRTKGAIKGLTTAAGIWATAMIGMAVGAGLYVVGIVASALTLAVFVYFSAYEQRVDLGWLNKVIKLEFSGVDINLGASDAVLLDNKIRIVDVYMKQDLELSATTVSYVVMMKSTIDITRLFNDLRALDGIKAATLDSEIKI